MLGKYYPAAKFFGFPPSVVDSESRLIMQGLLSIEEVVTALNNESQSSPASPGRNLRTGSMG